jgi:uncharacterized protein (TIGR02996 family)
MTETELLAGIASHPGELERWHILADWLEDQDDPRAELARLRYQLHTEPERADLVQRQGELLASGLAPIVPTWKNAFGVEFALVLPGSFWMGSLPDEPGRSGVNDEVCHRVTLTEPFFLGIYPVTVGEFGRFVTATSYRTAAERTGGASGYLNRTWQQDPSVTWRTPGFEAQNRHPVVCVNWNDAQKMIAWLNEVEPGSEHVYSLPTEAQWEYACRAGTTTPFFWGEDSRVLGEYVWDSTTSGSRLYPVNTKRPNGWGFHHLSGLVWEWCADWYAHYGPEDLVNPTGPARGTGRILRGGSWDLESRYCRSAYRYYDSPDTHGSARIGFRLAVSA